MGNPNVVFYLVDDYGNSSCSTVNSWASTNSITYNASFGNSGNVINMTDYGTTGMPKTVVIGPSHYVSFNVNGTISQTALQAAINNSLTGANEINTADFALAAFPNPAASTTNLSYTLASANEVSIDIMNELGEKVETVSLGKQTIGKHEYTLDIESLSNGVYFVKLNAGEAAETIKITVAH